MKKVGQYIDSLLRKKWSDAEIDKYIGKNHKYACLTYARDHKIRDGAASGGSVTSILINALENGLVGGVLVCKRVIEDQKVRPKFFIATTREEILAARGSCYVATEFVKEAKLLIDSFSGKLAVVGLPCNISALHRLSHNSSSLKGKIIVKISLLCGHNSRVDLIDKMTKRIGHHMRAKIISLNFRTGPWRGKTEAILEDGRRVNLAFKLYQNLYFFSEGKCLYCNDHFGYDADISVGDMWLYRFRNSDTRPNGIIIRTTAGDEIFQASKKTGYISVLPSSYDEILDGQSRAAPFHYNVAARHLAGKLLGISIPDKFQERVKWHHFLAALIVLLNVQWSGSRHLAPIIFLMPKSLLKFYLFLLKGLQSLK
jgi:coenzyme F420 hydrogenase subunit beta